MYQNAPPPHYNQGGYGAPTPPPGAPQQQQNPYGGVGYYDAGPPQQPPGYGPGGYHGASPVNAAYQRANAAMARGPSPLPIHANNMQGSGGGGAASSGLIRLTLRKPMGIVFEPMTDPHNPSQQRGVRICDLPRTGAAAMSLKLEVGDELLSINDKTMSRLTFDEIMDFIIEADKERVDLLFRRPNKDKDKKKPPQSGAQGVSGPGSGPGGPPMSPMGLGGLGSNSNSVKWIDEKSDMGGKLTEDVREPERDQERRDGGRERGGRGDRGSNKVKDDPSVDDTYNDGYTVESQSQYTMDTYEEDQGGRGGRGARSSRYDEDEKQRSRGGGRNDHRDAKSSRRDPVESSGFLDLLIDTLCTSVMGRDARDMCGDGSEDRKAGGGTKNKGGYYNDDDMTLDDGDGTYATYEENERNRHNHRRVGEDESLATEDEHTFVTNEDDGTRTLESKDVVNKKHHHQIKDSHSSDKKDSKRSSKSKQKDQIMMEQNMPRMDNMEEGQIMMDQQDGNDHQFHNDNHHRSADPPPHHSQQMMPPDPPTKAPQAVPPTDHHHYPQQQPQNDPIVVDHQMNEQESAIASGIAQPIKELEYDDRVDYAADVSVMESLGGPSLLVERARHENAVNTGAYQASYENLDRHDPELSELVAQHGEGFVPDPGMTREETAFRDPYKFYEFAVCALLRDNEPEKVRLLSKLMAKYRGRERHLINKLSARYNKEDAQGNAGGELGTGSASSADKGSDTNNNNLANKPSMSGMEKIHEGDGDEENGSSVLNDPRRANMAAIESAKKKLESSEPSVEVAANPSGTSASILPGKKSAGDIDGWPPAMSDPWGAAEAPAPVTVAAATTGGLREVPDVHDEHVAHHHHDDDDHSGSYSDGSSYTEDQSEVDGTSPAIIAQVSELLNYVYGKTSVAGQIDRVSTIMRAYEGREAVLLELLETKALIKANADSNRTDAADLPLSLRNSPGLNNSGGKAQDGTNGAIENPTLEGSSKKLTPQTPVSVLTAPTIAEYPAGPISPATVASAKDGSGAVSPSAGTLSTMNTTASKKKKKKIFSGFFGGKKNKGKGNLSASDQSTTTKKTASSPGKSKPKRGMGRSKGQSLNNEDDKSI